MYKTREETFLNESENQSNITVQDIHDYLFTLKQGVINQERDALLALNELKDLENNLKACKTEVNAESVTLAESYSDKKFVHKGFEIERRQGRATWNYKSIKEWQNKDAEKKELEKLLKARYEIYQKGGTAFDKETGEQLAIPSVTYSQDSIIFKKLK